MFLFQLWEVGKTSCGAMRKNAGVYDTVPISVWRGGGMRFMP